MAARTLFDKLWDSHRGCDGAESSVYLTATFVGDPFRRTCLPEGLNEIGVTLKHDAEISAFERQHTHFGHRIQSGL